MSGSAARTARRVPLVLLLVVLSLPAFVGSSRAADDGVVPGSDPRAARLLERAALAETALSFRAVEVVSDVGGVGTAGDGNADDVLEVSHIPGSGTVVVETSGADAVERAGMAGDGSRRPDLLLALLQRSYRLVLGGTDHVAGRRAQLVVAERPDGGVAARFWVDEASGLLLRRQVLARSGRSVSSQVLVRLWLSAGPTSYLPPLLPVAAPAAPDDAALTRWRKEGWPCPDRLGTLTLFDARRSGADGTAAAGGPVLHLTYSDGLSTASVFLQRGSVAAADVPGAVETVVAGQHVLLRPGRPAQLVWSGGGVVVTVVTDAPRDTVEDVVRALPGSEPAPTGWGRVERGVARVFSWVNPFD